MGNHKLFHHSSHSIILLLVISLYLSRSSSAQYSITGYDPADLRSENRLAGLFQQWKDKHGKTYRNVEETTKRFENFRRNLEFIVEWNSKRTGHTVGLNRFADLSNEEFREVYFSKIKRPVRFSKPSYTRQRLASVCNAPVSLDWRKRGVVTEVKDQGQCGNCWAFSATGAIEGINAINTGELINLSEQELIHHITSQDGFDGVFASDAFEWVINNGGIDTDDKGASKVVSIDNYEAVEESESGLLCAIVNQPVSVSIDGSTLDFQLYTGGIYEGSCSSNPKDTNHEVLVVGYGSQDGKDYWIVKNSWGTNWGINGYVYIRRNTNLPYGVCAINSLAYYPTQTPLAISPYPSPSPPPPPSPSPPPPPPSPPPPSPSHPPPPPSPPLPPPPLPPSPPPPPPPPSPPPPSPSPPPPSPPPSPPPPPPAPSPSPPPPPPPPSPSPRPPRPPLPPKPPCPPPTPVNCSCFTYCPPGQTCCCLQKFFNICLIHGCCEFPDAVCCAGSNYCCPSEHPIYNIHDGLCLKNPGDHFGVPAKKKKMAKHKFPWTKFEENEEMTCQPLKWRVNQFAIAALG